MLDPETFFSRSKCDNIGDTNKRKKSDELSSLREAIGMKSKCMFSGSTRKKFPSLRHCYANDEGVFAASLIVNSLSRIVVFLTVGFV